MEEGAKTLTVMLIISLILGLFVVAVHPQYRQTAVSFFRGEREQSALWNSNRSYYPEVRLDQGRDAYDSE